MTLADRGRRLAWRHSTRPIRGVRAIVLSRTGQVVLVRHSYTKGWYLPTGGAHSGESDEAAIRRELHDEIGLLSGHVEQVEQVSDLLGRRPHTLTTFVVRDAAYRPRWSPEIEEIGAFDPGALPPDISPRSRQALVRYLALPG